MSYHAQQVLETTENEDSCSDRRRGRRSGRHQMLPRRRIRTDLFRDVGLCWWTLALHGHGWRKTRMRDQVDDR